MISDLWVDMAEPQHLNEMFGQTELVNAFKEYARLKQIPNMTIAGAPGCGKTLLMKCFATDLGYIKYEDGKLIELVPGQFYLLDSSSDRSIEYVRETIKRISRKPTVGGMPRLIVLDEFNYKSDAQAAMRATMQECSDNTRFILLSNDVSNIIPAIISRCPIKIAMPLTFNDAKAVVDKLHKIKEFTVTPEAMEFLFSITHGDIREFIGKLQNACIISNFNVQIQHIQSTEIDIQIAKSILEAAQINFDQAREVVINEYKKIESKQEKNEKDGVKKDKIDGYEEAQESVTKEYNKVRTAKPIIKKLYEATYITKFSENPETNKIMAMSLREKLANVDFAITHNTNELLQLDSILNYIQLMKYRPLTCPKVK